MNRPNFYVLAYAGMLLINPAYAAESTPVLEAGLMAEWQNEYRDSDDDAIDGTNHSFLRAEVAPTLHLSERFFLDGVLVFEPFVQAAELNAYDSIWFDREGAFIEEIKLNYTSGPYAAWAGKFNPGFGVAWDFGRGIWSEDFAEDYEITEKLGLGGSYTCESKQLGTHTLAASTFFNDTSALSGSIITSRDKVRLSDGGAGNTEDFSSFAVSLSGENAGGIENLGYMLSYRFLGEQDKNRTSDTDDESGFAATLKYAMPLNNDLSFDMLAEYARLDNFEGIRNASRNYYSASVITQIHENWNLTVGYTLRDIKNDDTGASVDDHLLQLSGGYNFSNGLTAELGWRASQEAQVDTDIIGFLFRYTGNIL